MDACPPGTNFMIAVDTNILIYACDKADPRRQQSALDLASNGPPPRTASVGANKSSLVNASSRLWPR